MAWSNSARAASLAARRAKAQAKQGAQVTASGGGWYVVKVGNESQRFQGKAALEAAGFNAPS